MKNYTPKVEDLDSETWKVILEDNDTKNPLTWTHVSKSEFPIKQDAVNYLVKRYETQKDSKDRKKKTTKPKSKRKTKVKK